MNATPSGTAVSASAALCSVSPSSATDPLTWLVHRATHQEGDLFDPSPGVRQRAALATVTAADRAEVREALRAAAAQDEDVQVRWAARYVLRLAAGAAAGKSAG